MSGAREASVAVRGVAAVGLVVATVIHVMVALAAGGVLGALFWLSGLGTLVGAVLLFVSPRLGWIVGGGVSALTALAYIARSTIGLPPLIPTAVPFWRPTSGAVSAIVEIVVALLAVYALSGAGRGARGRTTTGSGVGW